MKNLSDTPEICAPPLSPKAQQILDAAAKLFLSNGFGAVSMDAIAKQAKVSKPTLYSHFQDKEALFSEIMVHMCQSAGCIDMLEKLSVGGPPETMLKELAKAKLDIVLNYEGLSLARIVFAETMRFPNLGKTFWESGPEKFYIAFESYLADLHTNGILNVPDPKQAALNFEGLLVWGPVFPLLVGVAPLPTPEEIEIHIDKVVADFLKLYTP